MREFQRFKGTKMPSFYTHNHKDMDEELTIDDQDAAVPFGMFKNSEKRAKERQSYDEYVRRKTDLDNELRTREE